MPARPDVMFPLRPPLPLPDAVTEEQLFAWLKSVRVDGAGDEIVNYCAQDFRRFVYTFGLVAESATAVQEGARCLELGANPYFSTMLLKRFTALDLVLANYFGNQIGAGTHVQGVSVAEFMPGSAVHGAVRRETLDFYHFNIEQDEFPFPDASFDFVLFCEIIEHLLMDPARVMREIRRVLRPGGRLILTTPNVARLENVARMLGGANIYDPYSGHGPYGRHNREYNKHELSLLLAATGFNIDKIFTADVHENGAGDYFDLGRFAGLLDFRSADLGQYIFLRARPDGVDHGKKPAWLYRSYAPDELAG